MIIKKDENKSEQSREWKKGGGGEDLRLSNKHNND
jgi:hypothetical protein